MKPAVVLVLTACIFIIHVQGQAKTSVQRCLCQGGMSNRVLLKRIDKVEIYPASPSCNKVEIIVTMKNDARKKCLNPESKSAQNIIKKSIEKRNAQ
ncbi:C-X-C motif chemokine 11-6-like [Trichomycterus rosablanca]|uniref:C-X-C motif chemokine 11-6-like n=1 Tax=Trichomycterus rosablanca TaxID=2290929 RepID=UPI002F360F30